MDTTDKPTFSVPDYIVFGVSVLASLSIGIYFGVCRKQKQTTEDYLVGGRKMSVLPVAFSLVVTFESSIYMMGTPAEVYFYGFQWVLASLGWSFALLFSAFAYGPMLHALKISSSFEYLEMRFQKRYVRMLGSILQILYYLLYMGIVLFGPAIALQGVTGIKVYTSVLLISFISIAYTSLGGMKAVVWTDFFQFGVMVAGIIAVLIKGTMDVGGINEVFRRSRDHGRLKFDFSFDPTVRFTVWIATIGQSFRMSGLLFNQACIQRISSLPTPKAAITALVTAAPWFVILSVLACMEGLVGLAYYDFHNCDPMEAKLIENENQFIVLMILQLFRSMPGLAGLYMSALFSASLSTLSSGLGSISANMWEDIFKGRIGITTQRAATLTAKATVIVAGVISVGISFLIGEVGGTVTKIFYQIVGIMAAPLTGMYLLGVLFPCANAKGTTIGAIVSTIITGWLSFGSAFSTKIPDAPTLPPVSMDGCIFQNDTLSTTTSAALYTSSTTPKTDSDNLGIDVIYTLSSFLYATFGIVICVLVGLVCSLILASDEEPVDPRLISPLVHPIWRSTRFMKKQSDNTTNKENYEIEVKL